MVTIGHRVADAVLRLKVVPVLAIAIVSIFLQPSSDTLEIFLVSTKILQKLPKPFVPCAVVRNRASRPE